MPQVEWTVTTRQATYSPPNWDDFAFGVWIPWWFDDFFGGGFASDGFYESDVFFGDFWPQIDPAEVETFSGRTDAGGTHYLQMDFDGDGEGLPTTVSAEATVFDVNRQAWSDGTDLLVHPGRAVCRSAQRAHLCRAGRAARHRRDRHRHRRDGGRGAIGITVEAGRLEWQIIDGRWEEVPVEIQTCTVTSADASRSSAPSTTDIGGTYQIVATVTDDAGRASRTEITRWVSGGNRRPARNVEQEEVTLIPDQQEYTPASMAEILVQAPFSPAEGLLTISRNGFVLHRAFTIEDGSTVLSIPIKDDYIPNLHIQVDLVGATERTADDGDPLPDAPDRPAFAVGRLNLQVPPHSRTLERCGRACRTDYRAGQHHPAST